MPVKVDLSEWEKFSSTFDFRVKSYEEKAKLAMKDAAKEIALELIPEIERWNSEAVTNWYAAYTPKVYNRRYFLYNVLNVIEDKTTDGELSVFADFDESIAYENGLPNEYQYQYVEGFHGGGYRKATGSGKNRKVTKMPHVAQTESPEEQLFRMADENTPEITNRLTEKIMRRIAYIDF